LFDSLKLFSPGAAAVCAEVLEYALKQIKARIMFKLPKFMLIIFFNQSEMIKVAK